MDDVKKGFECVICHLPARAPVVSPCCQRIIGCGQCVQRWLLSSSRCPLCSVTGRMTEVFGLKGIDDLTGIFRLGDNDGSQATLSPSVDVEATDDDSASARAF